MEKADIWPQRELTLMPGEKLDPVMIGIWDSGVDVKVFGDRDVRQRPNEKMDGTDTDGNGFRR